MTNKFDIIEIVNRRFIHTRNVISALTGKINEIPDINPSTSDPSPEVGSDEDGGPFSVPPDPVLLEGDETIDSFEPGTVVEEELNLNGTDYTTSLPFDFFRYVWFDGLLANYSEHYTLSGSDRLIPNVELLSGTQVIAQYVVGTD